MTMGTADADEIEVETLTKMKKRLLLGFICAIVLFILMISTDNDFVQRVVPFLDWVDYNDIACYGEPSHINTLPYLESDSDAPIRGKNIFFHETSCFSEEGLLLNARQACAVESAALMNPNMNVYLLFVSNAKVSNRSNEMFSQLSSYPNVKIRHINPDQYVEKTPLQEWYATGTFKKSKWPRSHMSDVLRYLTLWKYGGIYLDLDVVVTTSLEGLSNFAGAEDWDDVAAGVMGFSVTTFGRYVADACVRDLKKNFRGDVWGNNGPGVITRVLRKICSTKYTRDMTVGRCRGFRVYSPSVFYPIHYKKWKKYFEIKDSNATMAILGKARAIHVWNKLSKEEKVRVDSNVPYALVARKFCPKVFRNCGPVF